MTTLYDKTQGRHDAPSPEALRAAVEGFLGSCRRPAALEYGENPLPLVPGGYALEIRSGRLSIEIWDEARSVSRRILGLERAVTGLLDCSVQKFGGNKPGRLTFLDLERPQTAHRSLRGVRENFAERFRRMLTRQFPGWEIPVLSSGQDLRRSFSSLYPRAVLRRGQQRIAAMACGRQAEEAEMLSFALIWHRHVSNAGEAALCLFLPEDAGTLTAHRLRWLTGQDLKPRLFRFNNHGSAGEVDPRDLGNVQTEVSNQYVPPRLNAPLRQMLASLGAMPEVGCCPELNGSISIRSRGVEFARIEAGRLLLGMESREEMAACQTEEVVMFAARLSSMETRPSFPERQFESAVRENLAVVDSTLLGTPVHGQVLSFAAGDRDLIDLLAVSAEGRLAVLELKTSPDIHLPAQALDYWIRVGWHAERGELRHLFPGISLQNKPPTLLLVAPSMSFHPTTVTILRYFSPEIDVERVGISSDWRRNPRAVLRLRGSGIPISHGSFE